MAETPSTMMPLGTDAPDFELPDTVSGETVKLRDGNEYAGTVVLFICNHCPYVIHIAVPLAAMAKQYAEKGIRFIAISSNDVDNYPADAPDKMKVNAEENGYVFPYLYDETQAVAKAYDAACTPDIYLFDGNLKCVYRGQFDKSTPGNGLPATGEALSNALNALLAGEQISEDQSPSVGCNIKWKAQAYSLALFNS